MTDKPVPRIIQYRIYLKNKGWIDDVFVTEEESNTQAKREKILSAISKERGFLKRDLMMRPFEYKKDIGVSFTQQERLDRDLCVDN